MSLQTSQQAGKMPPAGIQGCQHATHLRALSSCRSAFQGLALHRHLQTESRCGLRQSARIGDIVTVDIFHVLLPFRPPAYIVQRFSRA